MRVSAWTTELEQEFLLERYQSQLQASCTLQMGLQLADMLVQRGSTFPGESQEAQEDLAHHAMDMMDGKHT